MPAGPSKKYSFSTATHGIRRRSAASASRARVWPFSFTSSAWRAASQSFADTTGGVCMADFPPLPAFLADAVMVLWNLLISSDLAAERNCARGCRCMWSGDSLAPDLDKARVTSVALFREGSCGIRAADFAGAGPQSLMPPRFRSTSAAMKDEPQERSGGLGWALPASLVVHSAVVVLLALGLPAPHSQPQKEDAISVTLVPPPAPPDKTKAKSPPAKPPSAKRPKQAEAAKPPPSRDAARPLPIPTLRPVFQFGEKDAGPRQSLEGNSPMAGSIAPTPRPDTDRREPAKPPAAAAVQTSDKLAPPAPAARTSPDPDRQEPGAPPALAAIQSPDQAPPVAPKTSAPKQAEAPGSQRTPTRQQAKTLFSRIATGSSTATTAIGALSPGERTDQLCGNELKEQLRRAWPPFFPEFGPHYPLNTSTVLDDPGAAFRSGGQWYEVSFRCEVDAAATKVVSFAFRVGKPIPRSEWQRRRFPSG